MTAGQWEQYARDVAAELEMYPPEVERVVALVGPRIAEDTRTRLVEAAAATVERDAGVEWVATAVPCKVCQARESAL